MLIIAIGLGPAAGEMRRVLEYAPAPVDNPLKGLVPYAGDVREMFPHSMEFGYLPYAALVKGYDVFDWQALETMLDGMGGRGHQAVFRIYLEYPGKMGVIPDFLLRDGLRVTTWSDPGNPGAAIETPDYADGNLRRSLRTFIAALGAKYDGDPRIGFITAGLLGLWGEWHTHPRPELFAGKDGQREVLDALAAAFATTPVLLRYPAGAQDARLAANADRPFGYHDDSFAWATLETGRPEDAWFFMASLRAAGPAAGARWKTHPIGGEIRPEAWGEVFDARPVDQRIQPFRECVEATHVTWLMDSGMFAKQQPDRRIKRAEDEVRRMGYEFHAKGVTIGALRNGKLNPAVEIENRGVAPFYYAWKPEWGVLTNGRVVKTLAGSSELTGLFPGDEPRVWTDRLDLGGIQPGTYTLALRLPNPMTGGKPVRFANTTQDPASGWLSLGEFQLPPGGSVSP